MTNLQDSTTKSRSQGKRNTSTRGGGKSNTKGKRRDKSSRRSLGVQCELTRLLQPLRTGSSSGVRVAVLVLLLSALYVLSAPEQRQQILQSLLGLLGLLHLR